MKRLSAELSSRVLFRLGYPLLSKGRNQRTDVLLLGVLHGDIRCPVRQPNESIMYTTRSKDVHGCGTVESEPAQLEFTGVAGNARPCDPFEDCVRKRCA